MYIYIYIYIYICIYMMIKNVRGGGRAISSPSIRTTSVSASGGSLPSKNARYLLPPLCYSQAWR